MTDAALIFNAERLAAVINAIVRSGGSTEYEADLVATSLVDANLAGHDSHGVGMIARYVDAILEGGLAINRHPRVLVDAGAMLSVDGCLGYGQVIARETMDLAIERARAHGTAIVALARSHHIGRIGQWAEQATAAGLVSIHFVNVLARPMVAPWGGGDARHGTNPFCVGIPRRDAPPIILDFATSRIAQGKARVAYNKGVPVPPGALIDDQGRPTTAAQYAVVEPFGALLPFGDHKGSGLALVCELLGGALTGGRTGHGPADTPLQVLNSMLSVLIDPERLGTRSGFLGETEQFVEWVKSAPVAAGFDQVRVAGDPERETRTTRLRDGIPVDPNTWEEILRAGVKLGLPRADAQRLIASDSTAQAR